MESEDRFENLLIEFRAKIERFERIAKSEFILLWAVIMMQVLMIIWVVYK